MGNGARLEAKWCDSMGRKKLLPSSSSCLLVTDREKQCAMSYLPQRQLLKFLVVPEVWDEWELGPCIS